MSEIIRKVFRPLLLASTCCYPVWCVSVAPLTVVAAVFFVLQAIIDGIREFSNEIGNPWRRSLYEANRSSVRPHREDHAL